MNIGILDIILVVIVLASALRCAFRGFIKEIMSMAALVLGFADPSDKHRQQISRTVVR